MSTLSMAQDDHPSYNIPAPTEQYAGDVLPLRPGNSMNSDMATASKQVANERSMGNIAKGGASSVDTSNLAVLRPR